jgi:hypothetical protein
MNKMSKFFTYRQNNSGGDFIINNGVDVKVIIEAVDYLHANAIAENRGLYFHGVSSGQDCSCCGDRWSEAWKEDGTEKEFGDRSAAEYIEAIENGTERWARHFIIYYFDGQVYRSRGKLDIRN